MIDKDRRIEKKYDRYSDSYQEKIPMDAKEKGVLSVSLRSRWDWAP
jgi:hypothetical protein